MSSVHRGRGNVRPWESGVLSQGHLMMLPQTGFLWGVLTCSRWLNSDSSYTSRAHHSRCSLLSRIQTTKTRIEGSLHNVRRTTESPRSIAPLARKPLGGVEPTGQSGWRVLESISKAFRNQLPLGAISGCIYKLLRDSQTRVLTTR